MNVNQAAIRKCLILVIEMHTRVVQIWVIFENHGETNRVRARLGSAILV